MCGSTQLTLTKLWDLWVVWTPAWHPARQRIDSMIWTTSRRNDFANLLPQYVYKETICLSV